MAENASNPQDTKQTTTPGTSIGAPDNSQAKAIHDAVMAALAKVEDPEIHRPITDLGMVDAVSVTAEGDVALTVLLTIAGCPMKNQIEKDVRAALAAVPEVRNVELTMQAMTEEQRENLKKSLRGGVGEREIPFAQPGNRTQVLLVASGKGGVGKSSVTVNLAMALANAGQTVGLLDADIYGHSIPAMLGLEEAGPTNVDDMLLPVPSLGLKVLSIGMMKQSRDQVIAWRGPILDRALHQLLSDVYWGDLDYLILDLPPGTGDIAMSLGNKLPGAEVIVVTTPQQAAAEVAERAGTIADMMRQRVLGVVENMSYLEVVPPCGCEPFKVDVFGTGGGAEVSAALTNRLGYDVPVLATIPLDPAVRKASDDGVPYVAVASGAESAAAAAFEKLAADLIKRRPSIIGKPLGLNVR